MVYKLIEPGIIIPASSQSFKFAYGIYVCGKKKEIKIISYNSDLCRHTPVLQVIYANEP